MAVFNQILPHTYSAFVKLRPGQTNISNQHNDPRTGMSSNPFPSEWNNIEPGDQVILKVLVPPGVNLVTWRVEAANLVALFGAGDTFGNIYREESYTPALYPLNYNGQSPTAVPVSELPPVQTPQIVYLSVRALSIPFNFLSMTVNYNIADPEAYEAWRSARSWAGGSGDNDGISDFYHTGARDFPIVVPSYRSVEVDTAVPVDLIFGATTEYGPFVHNPLKAPYWEQMNKETMFNSVHFSQGRQTQFLHTEVLPESTFISMNGALYVGKKSLDSKSILVYNEPILYPYMGRLYSEVGYLRDSAFVPL